MDGIQPRRIRVEQCEACATFRERFGIRSAFDYLVVEKLTDFADAAKQHPGFARELPAFVAEVRQLFTTGELRAEFARSESERVQRDLDAATLDLEAEDDDAFAEPPAVVLDRAARFQMIKQLLLANQLGTS
jgi:hypothetical protein